MKLYYGKDLSAWNTFGMKVSCACFVEYSSVARLQEFWKAWRYGEHVLPKPFLHIGRGSNLLFTKDFPGTVFHSGIRFVSLLEGTGQADASGAGEVMVEVGAGTRWDDFCGWCAERGLWGPENLSGIPGETGAAAVQNIGAYGTEFKDVVRKIRCFDVVTCSVKTFSRDECRYGYRDSIFKQAAKGRYIVTSAVFALSSGAGPQLGYGHVKDAVEKALSENRQESPTPELVRSVILGIRNSKLPDPAEMGNAGSFFKNPVVPKVFYDKVEHYAKSKYGQDYEVPHFDAGSGFIKIPAAWLIEQCGWKGYTEGNVGVYAKQPLVLVNRTGAVMNLFGIGLNPEVEHI